MRRVLIVDDDWRILQLLGDSLKQNYAVETAMNAGEAWLSYSSYLDYPIPKRASASRTSTKSRRGMKKSSRRLVHATTISIAAAPRTGSN